MATIMERVAARLGIDAVSVRVALRASLYAASLGAHNGVTNLTSYLIADYSHPTREGHELYAELIERKILSALAPLRAGTAAGRAAAAGRAVVGSRPRRCRIKQHASTSTAISPRAARDRRADRLDAPSSFESSLAVSCSIC